MTAFWRKIVVRIGYFAAGIIILAALLVSSTRLLTPLLNDHRGDFERLASQLLGRPVKIGEVEISWEVYQPELTFRNVILQDQQTYQPAMSIPLIRLDVAIIASLINRTLLLDKIKVVGVHLVLHQPKPGSVHVEGFSNLAVTDDFTGQSLNPNAILGWIFSQPKLVLQDFDVRYKSNNAPEKSITLKWLALENTAQTHTLTGKAILNQEIPTQVGIKFNWAGSVTDFSHVSADLYLSLEGISLSQWFSTQVWHGLHFKDGLGNAKVWANWHDNTWQKIQTTLQFYNVQAESAITGKSVIISRLNGNVGWQRQGDEQIIAGDNILIDLPNHLWPITQFTVKFSEALNGTANIKKINIDYLDLADTNMLIAASGLLAPEQQKELVLLNPEGVVSDLQAEFHGPFTDFANVSLTTQFSKLSFNAWHKLPAIAHLRGGLSWDGKQGTFKLDSRRTTIELNNVFANPLDFTQLTGIINWQKDAKSGWIITAKNIQANNLDLNANANFLLNIPVNDTATINLTGQFNLTNAAHASQYLPLKLYPADLATWLSNAFLSGQVVAGEATVQGKLADFPFEHGTGKFIISGKVKNLEFDYAPGWPMLHGITGNLLFSGKSMVVDLTAGQIADIPLGAIHGEILDLSHNPILTTKSNVQADLAQGLRFIQESPLQKTIGKNLAELSLQGPMQLALGLAVPLNNPDDTKVNGKVTIANAVLNLPAWNFLIAKLTGTFAFTENSLSATNLTGELFANPITLNLVTQNPKGKVGYLTAILQGAVNTKTLSNWLNLPIEEVLEGTINYRTELTLPPQRSSAQAINVVVRSDLKGATVKLPGDYAKNPTVPADFQLSLNINENQPLKAKINYNNLFSLATTLQRVGREFTLFSGDLHLGAGDANWQTEPGIIVTGSIAQIDWDKIQPYVSQFTAKNKTPEKPTEKSPINFELFRALDIRTNTLNFSGLILKNIRIQLTKTANQFLLTLNNPELAGQIILPYPNLRQGIQAKFQRLNLSSLVSATGGKTIVNPRDLPAISFVGEDVRYADMLLGRATLNLVPAAGGLAIRQLDLDSPTYKFRSSGEWTMSRSHLRGNIVTTDITELLKSWGFSSANLLGSTGNAEFDLVWPGSLFRPSIQGLSGTIALKLGRGRIINLSDSTNAQMGLGRLLNIFSLQDLPRRLSLDFSDLFQKGYIFDAVKGDFTLRNGNATTQNTTFNGPIAGIKIAGRIGLVAKDLDMKLDVTPYVTASLPVVAMIATANPIAGMATWLVDKVVSHAVSNMTTYNYAITGSWANPVWTHVGTQKINAPSTQSAPVEKP